MTKDNNSYNDEAFLYLVFTGLSIAIAVFSFILLRTLLSAQRREKQSLMSFGFKSFMIILLSVWLYQVFLLIPDEGASEFDPHKILNVPYGSFNTKEIKKSYRKMAIKLHPDKNIDKKDDKDFL
jgi:preprotein translocase subunit Sec63